MNDSTRDAALRALADPTTPADALMRVVSEHPDLGWQAARHPNAYPDLVDWVRRYAPAPDGATSPTQDGTITPAPDGAGAAGAEAGGAEAARTAAPGIAGADPAASDATTPAGVPDASAPSGTASAASSGATDGAHGYPTTPSGYPMHPPTPARPPRRRGGMIALLIVVAALVLSGGGILAAALWQPSSDPAPSGPDSGADGAGAPDADGADGSDGTDTEDGTDAEGGESAYDEPAPDERTDELEAAAKRNGFPVELQGIWCPDDSDDPEDCFSIDDWAAENPDGFVLDVGPANAYFERPGATGIQLCVAPDAAEGACSIAASVALTYYPAGVETRICDQPFVTEGYEGCEPGYEYDTTRDRLMIEANHQQDAVFHEAVPLYRR